MNDANKEPDMKNRIYQLVVKGSHGKRINILFDYMIMSLILLNVAAIILETLPDLELKFAHFFRIFEVVSVIIFTIEYMMRIYVSDRTHPASSRFQSVLKFIFSGYGLIDLFAILPFYLPFLFSIDLRFLRILRMIRFMSIFKINRYNRSVNLIWTVVKEKRAELTITVFLAFLILLIASFLMFYAEGEVQPDKFPNIAACFWWAIETLTTVGFGDVYPVTPVGKFISGLIAILGIGLVALPTGIVSAGFMQKITRQDVKQLKKCPHCGKDIQ